MGARTTSCSSAPTCSRRPSSARATTPSVYLPAGLLGRPLHRRGPCRAGGAVHARDAARPVPALRARRRRRPVQPAHGDAARWWGLNELTHPGRAGFLVTNGADLDLTRPAARRAALRSGAAAGRAASRSAAAPVALDVERRAAAGGRDPRPRAGREGHGRRLVVNRVLGFRGERAAIRRPPAPPEPEDARAGRPYLLRRSPFDGLRAAGA